MGRINPQIRNDIYRSTDSGGITFHQFTRVNEQWIMYYIGFPGVGFENGEPKICYATATAFNVSEDSYRGMFGSKTSDGWATFNLHKAELRRFGFGLTSGGANDVNLFTAAGSSAGAETETIVAKLFAATGIFRFINGIQLGANGVGTGVTIRNGASAPSDAIGIDGDIFIRSDGGALTTIYQRRSGVYVGIV